MTPPTSLAEQAEALAKQVANAVYVRNPSATGLDIIDGATLLILTAFQRLQSETREEDAQIVLTLEAHHGAPCHADMRRKLAAVIRGNVVKAVRPYAG